MKSDPQLRRWFRKFNKRCFANSLPDTTLVYWDTCDGHLGKSWMEDDRWHIVISTSTRFSKRISQMTLIHEMCHVAKPRAGHGKIWQQEMIRLANAGYFSDVW